MTESNTSIYRMQAFTLTGSAQYCECGGGAAEDAVSSGLGDQLTLVHGSELAASV